MQKNLRHRIEVELLVCGLVLFFFPKGRSGAPRWCKLFGSSKCWDYLGIDSLTEKKFSEKNSHHWFVHPTLEIIQVRSTLPKSGRDIRGFYLKYIYIYILVWKETGSTSYKTTMFLFLLFSYPALGFVFLPHISPLLSLLGHDSKGCAGICMRSLVFLGTVGYRGTQWTKTLVTGPPLKRC